MNVNAENDYYELLCDMRRAYRSSRWSGGSISSLRRYSVRRASEALANGTASLANVWIPPYYMPIHTFKAVITEE